jgi:hypothetical protein
MSNINPYCQYHYGWNVDVLKDVPECVRCHWFTRNGVSICSLTLYLSFSMSCVCCPVWIITYKEAFHILWYQTMQKVHCLKYQVQLTVPVGLHHQSNICCKTWHKKPVTEVCIGWHTLCWQFYHQWTDGSWCVAPFCCLHTVVLGTVCDSRDIAVKLCLSCNCGCSSRTYLPFNPVCTRCDRYIWLFCLVT